MKTLFLLFLFLALIEKASILYGLKVKSFSEVYSSDSFPEKKVSFLLWLMEGMDYFFIA